MLSIMTLVNTACLKLFGLPLVVEQEKQHQGLVKGIEAFDKNELHHADTAERNPLPDKDSMY